MVIATEMTSKGQITIPKEILNRLNLKTNDCLIFNINEKGEVVLTKGIENSKASKSKNFKLTK